MVTKKYLDKDNLINILNYVLTIYSSIIHYNELTIFVQINTYFNYVIYCVCIYFKIFTTNKL